MSADVQQEVDQLLEEASATSLDVEREHFPAKRAEGRRGVRLTTVARASRNSLLRVYRAQREAV
eukprot:8508428-Karenia_brevis.AAC.1